MKFEEAARRVHLGRSMAFFGAGFSRDATNINGDPVADTAKLAALLSEAVGETEPLPLDIAAQEYENKQLKPELPKLLQNEFRVSQVKDYQEHLSSLPWQRIYTTNYDNVVEFSRDKRGLPHTSPTAREKPRDFSGFFSVVHLHGFVGRPSKEDWDEAYVLTDQQYSADILRDSGWLETFRADAAYADAIFFFGYSVADLDIARLLYQNPSLFDKTFLVVGETAKRPTEIRVASYGEVIKQDVTSVASYFPEVGSLDNVKPAPYLASLERSKIIPAISKPSRDDVVRFLVKGDIDASFLARDIVNGTHDYYITRDSVSGAAIELDRAPMRLLFHSGLGNGKSCGLTEYAHYCLSEGWEVLWFNGDRDGLIHDVDYLASLSTDNQRKIAIICENCFAYSHEIRDLVQRFPLISFLLSTRSAALQTRIGGIEDTFGDEFLVYEMGYLTEPEISEFDDLLFANGLWGDRQGEEKDVRLSYIEKECRSDLATVLVDICRSSDIFSRVRVEFGQLDKYPPDAKKSLITALCMAYAGARLNVAQICEIVQADLFKYGKYQNDPIIREFLDFDRNRLFGAISHICSGYIERHCPRFH